VATGNRAAIAENTLDVLAKAQAQGEIAQANFAKSTTTRFEKCEEGLEETNKRIGKVESDIGVLFMKVGALSANQAQSDRKMKGMKKRLINYN